MTGRVVLVGTPIGNLADLSPRAAEALAAAEVIACEDTRRTGKLLELAGIDRAGRFVVMNEHTEAAATDELLGVLEAGDDVVVVSDAGMPGISDPGERLVAAAVTRGHDVTVIPGPSAALAALVASGLPTDRFVFEGFLPRKGPKRRARLAAISEEPRTVVLYESPHRVAATLAELVDVLGADRRVAVARELTKLYEELWRGTVAEAAAHFEQVAARGEVTIVLDGAAPPVAPDDADVLAAVTDAIDAGATTRDAVDRVSAELGLARKRVYDLVRSSTRGRG